METSQILTELGRSRLAKQKQDEILKATCSMDCSEVIELYGKLQLMHQSKFNKELMCALENRFIKLVKMRQKKEKSSGHNNGRFRSI